MIATSQSNTDSPFPNILPSDSCAKIRSLYGKASEGDRYSLRWKRSDIEISVQPDSHCILRSVEYFIEPGHTVTTPDGVTLGKDKIADAVEKLRSRIGDNTPFIWQGEGQIHATLELPSNQTFPFKSSYNWSLSQSTIDKLQREPLLTDFTSETVNSYTIEMSPSNQQRASTQ